jgi:hypothetical protein
MAWVQPLAFFSLDESLGGETMRFQANVSMKRYKI